MTVTRKINMDLARRGVIPRIDAVQADKYSRVVEISLYSGGIKWEPPALASIIVRYSRPDGKCGNYDALPNGDAAGSIDGNTISINLAPQVLYAPGSVHVAVGVIDGETEMHTFYMEIRVQKNPGGTDLAPKDYVDTSEAADLAEGTTAYVDGKKLTGTLPKKAAITVSDAGFYFLTGTNGESEGSVILEAPVGDDVGRGIVDSDTKLTLRAPASEFGDADADDVVAGKTFTSKAGFLVKGTHVCEGGIDTSDADAEAGDILAGKSAYVNGEKITGTHKCDGGTDTSDATAGAEDILSGKTAYVGGQKITGTHECNDGIDTSDATATAEDMANGVTAYVDGEKITGSVQTYGSGVTAMVTNASIESVTSSGVLYVGMKQNFNKPALFRAGSAAQNLTPVSNFGDATAADVAKGKTFTSAAGLKVTGTMEATGSITAEGSGDAIIITTSAAVSAAGDAIVIGG